LIGSLVSVHMGLANIGLVGGSLAMLGLMLCAVASYRFARADVRVQRP